MPRRKKPQTFLEKLQANEALTSRILGMVVVGVIGVMLYNYFNGINQGEITPESESVSVVESGPVYREEEGELIPTNLPRQHQVQRNESLWKIAEVYYGSGYNWVDLAQANNLTNPDHLEENQELTIPEVAVRIPLTQTVIESATASTIGGSDYTVQKGDHLWSIAVRAYGDGYRWTEIAQANELTNPSLIYPDQVLKLPRE